MTAAQMPALLCVAVCVGLACWLLLPRPGGLLTRLGASHGRTGHAGAAAGAGAGDRAGAGAVRDAALVAELLAATLAGGLAVPTALRAVATAVAADDVGGSVVGRGPLADALDGMADDAAAAHPLRPVAGDLAPVAGAVAFAAATGAPVVPLLTHAASAVRRRRRDAAVRASGRLAASLVMPLGLCALPGFLLLGVAPVVVRLVVSLG